MSEEWPIPCVLHVCTVISIFTLELSPSSDVEVIDFLLLPDIISKESISKHFLIIFFRFIPGIGPQPFSYPLMTGIFLKLLAHSRRSCKNVTLEPFIMRSVTSCSDVV